MKNHRIPCRHCGRLRHEHVVTGWHRPSGRPMLNCTLAGATQFEPSSPMMFRYAEIDRTEPPTSLLDRLEFALHLAGVARFGGRWAWYHPGGETLETDTLEEAAQAARLSAVTLYEATKRLEIERDYWRALVERRGMALYALGKTAEELELIDTRPVGCTCAAMEPGTPCPICAPMPSEAETGKILRGE